MKTVQLIIQATLFLFIFSSQSWSQPVSWGDLSIDGETIEFVKEKVIPVVKKTIVKNPKSRLSEGGIKKVANEFQLLKETDFNPHLSLLGGDIAFWYEQKLSENRLRLEFAARKIILDAADESGVVIKDQGVLAWAAQQLMKNLLLQKKELKK